MSKQSASNIMFMLLFGMFTVQTIKAQTDGVSIDYSVTPMREPKAILQLNSTDQGLIIPRMNATQRGNINPPATAEGMMVYQTDAPEGYYYWDGAAWLYLASSSGSGFIENRTADNAFGTGQTANFDVTGGGELGGSLKVGGNVGIGTTTPAALLSVGDWDLGASGTTTGNQVSIGGAHNSGVNSGGNKLYINGYDNDGPVVYPIFVEDENQLVDFWLKNRPTQGGSPTMYFAGNAGIGATVPEAMLHIADAFTSGGKNLMVGDDTYFTDVDVSNVLGLYGNANADRAGLRLGSDGSYLFGDGGNIGVGTTNPTLGKLQVNAGSIAIRASEVGGSQNSGGHTNLGSIEFFGHNRGSGNNSARIRVGSTGWDDAGYIAFETSTDGVDGTERMRIKEGGDITVASDVPIQFVRYAFNCLDNLSYNTGYSTANFNAGIVGMEFEDAYYQDGARIFMFISGTTWHIRAEIVNEGDCWRKVDVMFVRKEISSRVGY